MVRVRGGAWHGAWHGAWYGAWHGAGASPKEEVAHHAAPVRGLHAPATLRSSGHLGETRRSLWLTVMAHYDGLL